MGLLWENYPDHATIEVLPNVAHAPGDCFKAEGSLPSGVAAVVHSHPAGLEYPSAHDQAQQIATGKTWVICPNGGEPFGWGGTLPPPHLIRRPFRWGVTDCWGAVRDGLRAIYGVSVMDHPRDWQFWRETALFEMHTRAAGYEHASDNLADARETDVLLFRMRCDVFNHAALALGNGQLYHHPSVAKPFDETMIGRVESMDVFTTIPVGVYRRVA